MAQILLINERSLADKDDRRAHKRKEKKEK